MKQLFKVLIGRLLAEYRINWIYIADAPAPLPLRPGETVVASDETVRAALAVSPTHKMRNSLSYARIGLSGLALMCDELPLCVAHFATPAQYDCSGIWPLRETEMALMDIVTEEAARGQGVAPRMIAAATRHYLEAEASRLIAFVWWSNAPSVRAFTKAGWRRAGISLEWKRSAKWHHLHVNLRQ